MTVAARTETTLEDRIASCTDPHELARLRTRISGQADRALGVRRWKYLLGLCDERAAVIGRPADEPLAEPDAAAVRAFHLEHQPGRAGR